MKNEAKASQLWEATKMKKPAPEIIIIKENLRNSLISDAVTFSVIIGVFLVGVIAQSTAMQWGGFVMLFLLLLSFSSNKNKRLTIEEARTRLDEIERKFDAE